MLTSELLSILSIYIYRMGCCLSSSRTDYSYSEFWICITRSWAVQVSNIIFGAHRFGYPVRRTSLAFDTSVDVRATYICIPVIFNCNNSHPGKVMRQNPSKILCFAMISMDMPYIEVITDSLMSSLELSSTLCIRQHDNHFRCNAGSLNMVLTVPQWGIWTFTEFWGRRRIMLNTDGVLAKIIKIPCKRRKFRSKNSPTASVWVV